METITNNEAMPKNEEKQYPTLPDEKGFLFENAEEEEEGIATKVYDNGSVVKRVIINRGKTEVIVRELLAKDSKQTAAMAGFVDGKKGSEEDLKYSTIHVACTFNGEKLPMDDIACLKMKDFSLVWKANQTLNF